MKVVSFILPEDYVLPVTLENLSPDVLASFFNCMAYMIDNICIQESNKDQLKVEYEEMKKKLYDDTNQQLKHLKYQLDQTNSAYQREQLAHSNEKKLIHEMYATSIKDKDDTMKTIMTRFDEMMTFFHSFRSNSAIKGQVGEHCMRNVLHQLYPHAEIIDTSHVPHAGDIVIKINDYIIMLEIKTKQYVTKEDIDKFQHDVNLHKNEYHAAIFLTTSNGIPNKGEFVFDFIENIPVLFLSKYIDSPHLLHFALNVILNLIPIFKEYNAQNIEQCTLQDITQSLSTVISTATNVCDMIRLNNKTIGTIVQQLLEQKKRNEDKLKTYFEEISRITDKYKLKFKTSTKNTSNTIPQYIFDLLYNEFLNLKGNKYIYKKLIQNVVKNNSQCTTLTTDQIYKKIPKHKFEQFCEQKQQNQQIAHTPP